MSGKGDSSVSDPDQYPPNPGEHTGRRLIQVSHRQPISIMGRSPGGSMTDHSRPLLLVLNAGSSSVKFSLYDATDSGPGNPCLGHGSLEAHTDTERLIFRHA